MTRTIGAVIDQAERVQLLESVQLSPCRRALVMILEEEPSVPIAETALLSELALAEDWN
jgi:hypothetical protein